MFTFTPAQRITSKSQFDAVYQRGSKLGDAHFLILYLPNGMAHSRLGLSISARTVGNAINRNRIKRVIRESFRLHAGELPPVDIVVNSRNAAREASNAVLTARLQQHWSQLRKRCATC